MWKVSWLYEKVHNFFVVPLYYRLQCKVRCISQLKVTHGKQVLSMFHYYYTVETSGWYYIET